MVHVPALAPALLLGVATAAAASALPTTSSVGNLAAASDPPHILFSEDATTMATATATATTISHANTNTNTDTETDTDIDSSNTAAETFDTVQLKSIKRCNRSPLKCDCSKNATELAALNALRAKNSCSNCTCHKNGAGSGAGGGQLVKSVAAAVVGVAGVVALL
ncbi:hypothetical protein F5144DRAFT_326836 [Chaetomium tenue]|uniref:Uncharacterized protein n=1 Tax=Chaetomium tenue TaxID=1854479 RepID=A0ACB7P6N3_9PEZI|nr:hypothetical protein F5144DRAFT_326836 [Chaetomium globosum]